MKSRFVDEYVMGNKISNNFVLLVTVVLIFISATVLTIVVMNMFNNKDEHKTNYYKMTSTVLMSYSNTSIAEELYDVSKCYNLDLEMILSIIKNTSRFNPDYTNRTANGIIPFVTTNKLKLDNCMDLLYNLSKGNNPETTIKLYCKMNGFNYKVILNTYSNFKAIGIK